MNEVEVLKEDPAGSHTYNFSLFISTGSAGSEQAMHNLRSICERIGNEICSIEIVNIKENPGRAEKDRILAIPTLIKLSPDPVLRIIGDLSDHTRVLNALGYVQ